MNYKQMIEQARANGMATEKKMWAAVETLSTDLLALEQTDPKLYWHILRRQHAVLYGRHYSEKMANHDVNALVYSGMYDEEGTPTDGGAHWTRIKVDELTKGMKFHANVNAWDKYVAFNSMYADLCACMNEDEIIKAAYAFYFCDDDWQPCEDDCTKVWDYNALHASL